MRLESLLGTQVRRLRTRPRGRLRIHLSLKRYVMVGDCAEFSRIAFVLNEHNALIPVASLL